MVTRHMTGCTKCGTVLFNTTRCEECGDRYCFEHASPREHDCNGLEVGTTSEQSISICRYCEREPEYICNECGGAYCSEHIELEAHDCDSSEEEKIPDHARRIESDTKNYSQSKAATSSTESLTHSSSNEDNESILVGAVWMIVISFVLFWLPLLGPLIAGYVGGKKAGGAANGIVAALLPAIIVAVFISLGTGIIAGLPIVGALLGAGFIILIGIYEIPLIGGAVVGGALA